MKKEVIIAIGIGFILGSLTAIAIINLPKAFNRENNFTSQKISPSPVLPLEAKPETVPFTVILPNDNQISGEKTAEISGKYRPDSIIIIETDDQVKTAKTNSAGEFSEKINLTEGVNNIHLTSYNPNLEPEIKTLTVFYTPEKL